MNPSKFLSPFKQTNHLAIHMAQHLETDTGTISLHYFNKADLFLLYLDYDENMVFRIYALADYALL